MLALTAAQAQPPRTDAQANSRFEAGEDLPGGAATSRGSVNNRNAFSHHSGNLNARGEFRFKLGNAIFRKLWVSAPASTKSSDGLGPLYNARSCQRCHLKDGRGHPPSANWPKDNAVSMFLRLSIPPQSPGDAARLTSHRSNVMPEPTYGTQLQDFAIQGHAAEGRMHVTYDEVAVSFPDGDVVKLRRPSYRLTDLAYGPPHADVMISPRVAPQMIGLGLLQAIPAAALLAGADPDDVNQDGVSGRPNRVWSLEHRRVMLGRFGWKAGAPTVRQQSAEAFAGDIGISNSLVPRVAGDCTARQQRCLGAPHGSGSSGAGEVSDLLLDLVAFYASNLAVPKRRNAADPRILRGKRLFHNVGCALCHTPSFRTGDLDGQPHLANHTIWPYSDLLLHDMGEGLADNRPEGVASGQEWRTAPLWGIGLTQQVSGHSFLLHDGRARNVTEAILWHGGEAQSAREAFTRLSREQRKQLLAFVNSL